MQYKSKSNELLEQFDQIIEDAPVDFLGTGSDSKCARKQQLEWENQVELFRIKLKNAIQAKK